MALQPQALCSARAAKVLRRRGVFLLASSCGAGNRDVLLILLPFTTFVTFLSFLFQAEEKIIKKNLKAHNEIKCNSCYIHISGGSPAISSCLPSSGSLWAGVWRGWIRVSYDTVQPVPSTPQCKEATSASEWL